MIYEPRRVGAKANTVPGGKNQITYAEKIISKKMDFHDNYRCTTIE